MDKHDARVEGNAGGCSLSIWWSCGELDTTDVRLRYQRIGPLPILRLRRTRHGQVVTRRGLSWRRTETALPPELVAQFADTAADRLVLDSYSGDSRWFRCDALRVGAPGWIDDEASLDALVALAVAAGDWLVTIGAVEPRHLSTAGV
jgi:hypothetical protein